MTESLDTYKSKKGILKNVIKDPDKNLPLLKDAVERTHLIVIYVYQFIKSYYLFCYETDSELLSFFDEKGLFINSILQVVSQASKKGNGPGPPQHLLNFYKNYFEEVSGDLQKLPSRKDISLILGYAKTNILTVLKNNIKTHFISRLNGFINSYFDVENQSLYDKCKTQKERKALKIQIRQELKKVKNDILDIKDFKLTSDPKYHEWIKIVQPYLVPLTLPKKSPSINYDVHVKPLKYLKYMVFMDKGLEAMGKKQFHAFPLRSEIVPASMDIDTSALINLMMKKGKGKEEYKNKVKEVRDEVWNMFFKLNDKMFKLKGYYFDYAIKTDGISISVRFKVKSPTITHAIIETPKLKNMSKEIPYLQDLTKEQVEKLKECHLIYVDPNKGNLVYCIDDEDVKFRYTRDQRIKETQRIHHQNVIKSYKKKEKIRSFETEISQKNSKTCNFSNFMEYLKIKNKNNIILFQHYKKEFFRKMRLRTYINTQRSESKLVRNIKHVYRDPSKDKKKFKSNKEPCSPNLGNKEIVLIYGDGNQGRQMKHIISTPMSGLKKTLSKNFPIIHIDEFRTSCLDWRTEERNENAYVKTEEGSTKKLHSVLVSKIQNINNTECKSFQNRDLNSVKNMRKITQSYIENGERPLRYRRGQKLSEDLVKSSLAKEVTGSLNKKTCKQG